MPPAFRRSPQTWLYYLAFSVYGYILNGLGPILPFLKSELNLTYTAASLHFSVFAAGMILTGLCGHLLAARKGRKWVLWFALFGMSTAALAAAAVQTAWMTIGASFLMGTIGSLFSTVVPSGLANEHGENRAIALAELNLIAAAASAAAALAVGWFSSTFLSWRFALVMPMLAALVLRLALGRVKLTESGQAGKPEHAAPGGLPRRFWLYWLALILAVSVEYCMVFWCADYLENAAGLPKAAAAQAVSLFLAGVIAGRVTGSRLLRRFNPVQILSVSILAAAAGFLMYWSALTVWLAVLGLFVAGLGVANQYPMIFSQALGAAGGRTVQAGTRAVLGSGIAILTLPLFLGRLADALGIRLAYGVIAVLLAAAFTLVHLTERSARMTVRAGSDPN